jgi:hypothetical protein
MFRFTVFQLTPKEKPMVVKLRCDMKSPAVP